MKNTLYKYIYKHHPQRLSKEKHPHNQENNTKTPFTSDNKKNEHEIEF